MFISYVNPTSFWGFICDGRFRLSGLFQHQIISTLLYFFQLLSCTIFCLVERLIIWFVSFIPAVSFCLFSVLLFLCAHRRSPRLLFCPIIHLYCRKCYLITNTHLPIKTFPSLVEFVPYTLHMKTTVTYLSKPTNPSDQDQTVP